MRSVYDWVCGWLVPVWPMFTITEDVSDEVEVLIFLVSCAFGRWGGGAWFELFEHGHCLWSTWRVWWEQRWCHCNDDRLARSLVLLLLAPLERRTNAPEHALSKT